MYYSYQIEKPDDGIGDSGLKELAENKDDVISKPDKGIILINKVGYIRKIEDILEVGRLTWFLTQS